MVTWTPGVDPVGGHLGVEERGDDQKPSAYRLGRPWRQCGLGRAVHPAAAQPLALGSALPPVAARLGIGLVLGFYFDLRRDRYSEPGSDADETRFPR